MEGVSRRYGYWVTLCLALVYALNFMDRQLVSILVEPIKKDLSLSDTEVGLLSGFMFAIFYSALAIPVARLADRGNRVRIVAICCAIWSLFTMGCGLAVGFATLALSRVGVAVGEAGGSPPSYSILADYFPPKQRATAAGIYSLGVPVGVMAGALIGGWLAADFGWRIAFIALGAAGLLIAPLLPFLVKEPTRGRFDTDEMVAQRREQGASSLREVIRLFFSSRLLLFTGLGSGLSSFTGYALIMWLPAFLIRDAGMSLYEIALYYSPVSGASLAIGTWLGGLLSDRIGRKNPAAYGAIPAVAALIALPFLVIAMITPSWPVALALLAVPLTLGIMYLPPAITVIQNNLPADSRATGSAILLFWFNIVGLGCGPLYVGIVSDHLAPTHGGESLSVAIQWLAPAYLLCVLFQLAAARAAARS